MASDTQLSSPHSEQNLSGNESIVPIYEPAQLKKIFNLPSGEVKKEESTSGRKKALEETYASVRKGEFNGAKLYEERLAQAELNLNFAFNNIADEVVMKQRSVAISKLAEKGVVNPENLLHSLELMSIGSSPMSVKQTGNDYKKDILLKLKNVYREIDEIDRTYYGDRILSNFVNNDNFSLIIKRLVGFGCNIRINDDKAIDGQNRTPEANILFKLGTLSEESFQAALDQLSPFRYLWPVNGSISRDDYCQILNKFVTYIERGKLTEYELELLNKNSLLHSLFNPGPFTKSFFDFDLDILVRNSEKIQDIETILGQILYENKNNIDREKLFNIIAQIKKLNESDGLLNPLTKMVSNGQRMGILGGQFLKEERSAYMGYSQLGREINEINIANSVQMGKREKQLFDFFQLILPDYYHDIAGKAKIKNYIKNTNISLIEAAIRLSELSAQHPEERKEFLSKMLKISSGKLTLNAITDTLDNISLETAPEQEQLFGQTAINLTQLRGVGSILQTFIGEQFQMGTQAYSHLFKAFFVQDPFAALHFFDSEVVQFLTPEQKQLLSFLEPFKENEEKINAIKEYLRENKDGYNSIIRLNILKDIEFLFEEISRTTSKELHKFQQQILSQVLSSEKPRESYEQIKLIFEKNNLPLMGKVYKVFEILHPPREFERKLKEAEANLSPVLLNVGPRRRYELIYTDLLKVNVFSANPSLFEYVKALQDGQYIFDIALQKGINALTSVETQNLVRFLNKMDVLYANSLHKRLWGEDIKSGENIGDRMKQVCEMYGIKPGQSLVERATQMFLKPIGFTNIDELISAMNDTKKNAHIRNLTLAGQFNTKEFMFNKCDLLKGVESDWLSAMLQNGVVAKEYLGEGDSDKTPFDTDMGMVTTVDPFSKVIESSPANEYGDLLLIVKDRGQFELTNQKKEDAVKQVHIKKYELFYSGVKGEKHYGIRTGFASTEIDAIVAKQEVLNELQKKDRLFFSIAQNGFYIPVFDMLGHLVFTPEQYNTYKVNLESINTVLNGESFSPQQLLNAFKESPYVNSLFNEKVGVKEKYTLEQHTLMVLTQFEKYFAHSWNSPILGINKFRILLALHDIGKPLAIRYEGDKSYQHTYTSKILPIILQSFGLDFNESLIVSAIASQDYLGEYIQGKLSKNEAGKLINAKAREVDVSVEEFMKLLISYYKCDAGSYTSDAGGIASLDTLPTDR